MHRYTGAVAGNILSNSSQGGCGGPTGCVPPDPHNYLSHQETKLSNQPTSQLAPKHDTFHSLPGPATLHSSFQLWPLRQHRSSKTSHETHIPLNQAQAHHKAPGKFIQMTESFSFLEKVSYQMIQSIFSIILISQ